MVLHLLQTRASLKLIYTDVGLQPDVIKAGMAKERLPESIIMYHHALLPSPLSTLFQEILPPNLVLIPTCSTDVKSPLVGVKRGRAQGTSIALCI